MLCVILAIRREYEFRTNITMQLLVKVLYFCFIVFVAMSLRKLFLFLIVCYFGAHSTAQCNIYAHIN